MQRIAHKNFVHLQCRLNVRTKLLERENFGIERANFLRLLADLRTSFASQSASSQRVLQSTFLGVSVPNAPSTRPQNE